MWNWVELQLRQLWEGSHSAIGMKQSARGTFEHLSMFSCVLSTDGFGRTRRLDTCYQGACGSKLKGNNQRTVQYKTLRAEMVREDFLGELYLHWILQGQHDFN